MQLNAGETEKSVGDKVADNQFDSFYFGLGVGGNFVRNTDMFLRIKQSDLKDQADMETTYDSRVEDKRALRPVFSIVSGIGTTFWGKAHIGVEGLMDFSKSKSHNLEKHKCEYSPYDVDGVIKASGNSTILGVRLGCLLSQNCMIYARPSIVFTKTELLDYKEYI